MNPFEALVGIARRSQKAASALPEKEATQSLWAGVGFSLHGNRFVVELHEVSELIRIPQHTTLPEVKPWVMGVANVRGRLLTMVDLALFFGHVSTVPRAQRRILVVDHDEDYFGFLIDESLGMQHFPRESHEEQAVEIDEVYAKFIRGSYLSAGVTWPVVSLLSLLEDSRFTNLAEL